MASFLLIAFAASIDLFQAFITFTIGIIPFIGFPIALAINVAVSVTLGLILCLALWQAGYFRRGFVLPGFFAEAIPVVSSFPFWTAMTVASIYSAKRRKRRLAITRPPAQQDKREGERGKEGSLKRGILATTPQGRARERYREERGKRPGRSASQPLARQVDGIQKPVAANDNAPIAANDNRE